MTTSHDMMRKAVKTDALDTILCEPPDMIERLAALLLLGLLVQNPHAEFGPLYSRADEMADALYIG